MKVEQGLVEEWQVSRWIDNFTAEQNARLYHKVDNTRGSDYVRARSVVLDVVETMEKKLVDIAGGCQVGSRTVEIGYGVVHHGCSADDVIKGQAK